MINPRHETITEAEAELLNFLVDWYQRHDLTPAEITQIFLTEAIGMNKHSVRFQRTMEETNT